MPMAARITRAAMPFFLRSWTLGLRVGAARISAPSLVAFHFSIQSTSIEAEYLGRSRLVPTDERQNTLGITTFELCHGDELGRIVCGQHQSVCLVAAYLLR